jgi:hypothetical protein
LYGIFFRANLNARLLEPPECGVGGLPRRHDRVVVVVRHRLHFGLRRLGGLDDRLVLALDHDLQALRVGDAAARGLEDVGLGAPEPERAGLVAGEREHELQRRHDVEQRVHQALAGLLLEEDGETGSCFRAVGHFRTLSSRLLLAVTGSVVCFVGVIRRWP